MPEQKRSRRASKKPEWQKNVVIERVSVLFREAKKEFSKHPERSHRYIGMALKLCMRYNVNVPDDLKRSFCRHCKSYIVPGVNCRVRTSPSQKAVIVTCGECGKVSRHPYRKEKREGADRKK